MLFYSSTKEQDAQLKAVGIPLMELTSTFDLGYNQQENRLADNALKIFRIFAEANGITLADTCDFASYPMIGLKTDEMSVTTINGEWRTFLWTIRNKDGIPLLKMSCTENLTHALYPGYGEIAWNFMKDFSRDPKTGGVVYTSAEKQ